jgi:hypothetical protein
MGDTSHISIAQMWESFAMQFPADVSPDTQLYKHLRDTWYAASHNMLVRMQEIAYSAERDIKHGTEPLAALFDECERYLATETDSYVVS